MLLLNLILIELVLSGLLYWQWSVVTACREYFRQLRERSKYAHLTVPGSFVNSQADEQSPFVGRKSADYMVFSLEQVDLDEPGPKKEGEEENRAVREGSQG
jgi:hypothetical protein